MKPKEISLKQYDEILKALSKKAIQLGGIPPFGWACNLYLF